MIRAHAEDFSRPLPPEIGLCYDTSTLQINDFDRPGRYRHIDLATPTGREWLYVTIREILVGRLPGTLLN